MINNKNCNILVTGASGFVGSHLVTHLLLEGYTRVTALLSSESSLSKLSSQLERYHLSLDTPSLRVCYADLCCYDVIEPLLEGVDVVFHAAARVDLGSGETLIHDNVLMTECLVSAAVKHKVGRFVHVSSIATLEEKYLPAHINEQTSATTLQGKSAYSISKIYSENIVWRAALTEGLAATIVLPAVILGKGSEGGSSSLLRIYSNTLGLYTPGSMSYVSVEDVARAMVLLAFREDAIGDSFILSSDNLSYKELFTLCAKAASHRQPRVCIGGKMLSFLGSLLNFVIKCGVKLPINGSTLSILNRAVFYDGSKVKLRYDFKYTPISEVIDNFFSLK